jgi:hypothetical protein
MSCNEKKTARTLSLLGRRWLTAPDSAQSGGVLSLAQRVSTWRADGLVIADKWVQTSGGARIKAYRWIKPRKSCAL